MSVSTINSPNVPFAFEEGREYQSGDFCTFSSNLKKGTLIRITGHYPTMFGTTKPEFHKPLYLVVADVASSIIGVDAKNLEAVRQLGAGRTTASFLAEKNSPVITFKNNTDEIETSEDYRDMRVTCTIAVLCENYFEHLRKCSETGGCILAMEFPEPTLAHCDEVCQANSIHRTRPHDERNGQLQTYTRNPNFIPNLFADPKRNNWFSSDIIAQKKARDRAIVESGDEPRINRLRAKVLARLERDEKDYKRHAFLLKRVRELEVSHPRWTGCPSLAKHQDLLMKVLTRNLAIINRHTDDLAILSLANAKLGIVPEATPNEEARQRVAQRSAIIWRGVLTPEIFSSYGLEPPTDAVAELSQNPASSSVEGALVGLSQNSGLLLETPQ